VLNDVEKAAGLVGKIGKRLKPPKSKDPTVNAWRWFIVMTVTANSVALTVHILLACGMTPFFAGFAYASEQHESQAQLKTARLEQLDWRLFDLRVKQCEAISKGESPRVFTWQLDQLTRVYLELSGRLPQLPSCEQIG